jgi:hypothetical protein
MVIKGDIWMESSLIPRLRVNRWLQNRLIVDMAHRPYHSQCTNIVRAKELVISIWYEWPGLLRVKTTINSARAIPDSKDQTTVNFNLVSQVPVSIYATYSCTCTVVPEYEYQASTIMRIRTSASAPESEHQIYNRFDRKTTNNASASNVIPKTAFAYLNIFRAKTTKNKIQSQITKQNDTNHIRHHSISIKR